jgi:lipid-binding SYLF domain-containing protein
MIMIASAALLTLVACSQEQEATPEDAVSAEPEAAVSAESEAAVSAENVEAKQQEATAAAAEAEQAREAAGAAQDAIDTFETHAEAMGAFENAGLEVYFAGAHGWALFPTVGKAGFGVGGAFGRGQVYAGGQHVGNARMTQLSVGFQAGGQAFSQIIFLENQGAFDNFTSGNFEFGAGASAVAVTAGVDASARTTGSSASASGSRKNAAAAGQYHDGMATFTMVKGGLMYEAAIAGQKFSYAAL